MTNEISPPDWFLRPESWPYWMPSSLPGTFSLPLPPASPWDRSPSTWSHSATPSSANGGILGSFPQANDTWDAGISGLLGSAKPSRAGGGLLASLSPPVDEPPNDSWPKGPTAWDVPMPPSRSAPPLTLPPTLPIPPAPPFEFPASPPVEHLHSARYWGAAQTPAGPEPPAHGFYLSPVPHAPRWDQLPTNPANSAAQIFQEPPSPTSWSASAPDLQDRAAPNLTYSPLAPARQTEPRRLQLAGMARPFPGMWPPIPPLPVPGTPEWTDHFIRGLQGLIRAFTSSGRRGGRRSDDDDYCTDRLSAEMSRCDKRIDDYAHQDFLAACKQRAKHRWDLCNRNGGRPHPNEPNEWGPEDEEIWRNFGR